MAITTITVCETCAWAPGARLDDQGRSGGAVLAEAVEALATGAVVVRRHACLMGCDRPCAAAVAAPGKMAYVLVGFQPGAEAAEALVAYARAHAEAPDGVVPFKQWPQGVRGHFRARLPPLGL